MSERKSYIVKLGKCGRVPIPKEFREKLGFNVGDRVVFYFNPEDNSFGYMSTEEFGRRIKEFT